MNAHPRWIPLALLLASCGEPASGKPGDPAGTTCRPEDLGSATPGDLEAALTTSLRGAAGLEAIFGDRTQEILDQADALRVDASRDAARGAGLPVPDEEQLKVGGLCSPRTSGLTAQAWAFRELAMAHAVASLPEAIERLPISTSTPAAGTRANETGDPRITASYNAYYEGNGKSEVAVEVRGVVDISSPTKGSIHEDNEARVSLDVCPDANGHANGKVHFKFGGIATPAGGDPWTYGATMDSEFRFEVDDEAEIAQLVIDSSATYRTTGAGAVSVAGHGSITMRGSSVTAVDLNWDHEDGPLDTVALVRREMFNAALMAAVVSRDEARAMWRGGKCVEVRTDREGGTVPARRKVSLTATAHHKFEGNDVEAKIQGWLDGPAELSNLAQHLPSPATYDYTPGEDQQTGTVHFETVSKRGIGRKDLVFTASGGGWTGSIRWTVRGSLESSADGWTRSWSGDGSGKITVKPGPQGTAAVDSATFSYGQTYHGDYHSEFDFGGCHHSLSQTEDESLAGTGTEGSLVVITPGIRGTGLTLLASVPYGTISGERVVHGSESVTGPDQQCRSPADSNTTSPWEGTLPSGSFQVDDTGADLDRIQGTATLHTDGTPPLDWEFTYALTR